MYLVDVRLLEHQLDVLLQDFDRCRRVRFEIVALFLLRRDMPIRPTELVSLTVAEEEIETVVTNNPYPSGCVTHNVPHLERAFLGIRLRRIELAEDEAR